MLMSEVGKREKRTRPVTARIIHYTGEENDLRQTLLEEYVLKVFHGDRELFRQTCTPELLTELIAGHLLTQGWIRGAEDIRAIEVDRDRGTAVVDFHENTYIPAKRQNPSVWDRNCIRKLYERFITDTELHRSTRAAHSAFLQYEGRIVAEAEDLGRHNAVDKVIGRALLDQIPLTACTLFTTGRMPEDMVLKAVRAGIPVLVSKEVPTTAGLRAALDAGITMIGKVREDSMVLYTYADVS